MNRTSLSRRALLKKLGLGAAMLPLLEADFATAAPVAPKRIIFVVQTNGVIQKDFYPSAAGALGSLPSITAPLAPYKNDLVIMRGLAMPHMLGGAFGAGHDAFPSTFLGRKGKVLSDKGATVLTPTSPTLDQYLAAALEAKGVATPFRSLDLAVYAGPVQHQNRCFFKGEGSPINPEQDPARAFKSLVAGLPKGGTAAPVVNRAFAENQSVLGYLKQEIDAFAGKLGKEDQRRIAAHRESVRELEAQLAASAAGASSTAPACTAPPEPKLGQGTSLANDNYPAVFEQHLDLIVAALKCDVTRVVTLMTNTGNGLDTNFTWLDLPATQTEYGVRNYHGISHQGGDSKAKIDTWYMQRFASLLERLAKTQDVDGRRLLDNTVVLWANHMDDGNTHGFGDIPWLLAGSCGGALRTGQFLDLRANGGQSTIAALKVLCEAMGVDPTAFIDPQFVRADISALEA